jgi:hypothetical protein
MSTCSKTRFPSASAKRASIRKSWRRPLRFVLFRTCAALATALACHLGSSSEAAACAYHGGKGFSANHPGSFDVAIAVQIAAEAGTIETTSAAPPPASMVAYHRMVKQIEQFRDLMGSAARGMNAAPAFSLLLIDSALWSRFIPDPSGIALSIHTAGPESGEPVVLTSGAVIRSLLDGRLSSADALHRGLIRVEARIDAKLALFDLIAASNRP